MTTEANMFELATRQKLRFRAQNGMISVEDLWDLPLSQLDDIAKKLRRKINESEESFVEKNTSNEELELSFNIAKHIISVKLAEREERATAQQRKERRQILEAALERKQNAALENMTEEQLQQELDALKL